MQNSLALIGLMAVMFVVFAVIYVAVHYKMNLVNAGRTIATLVIGGATGIDQLGALPWGTILSDAEAKMVMFGLALANVILHQISIWSANAAAAAVSPAPAPAAPVAAAPAPLLAPHTDTAPVAEAPAQGQ